jgi:peptidyl-prolyl cis-trans isomerase A (cyclophilin A)
MKTLFVAMMICGAAVAQTKSAPKAAPKAAPAKPDLLAPSTLTRTAPPTYKVKFVTTKGDVIIEVTRAWAPRVADRFYNLVRAGFFTDAAFFRVLPGFMAQFGISARPDVARAWDGAKIPDDPVKQSNKRGMITFATAGPNTRTTQLFINYVDNSRLDGQGFAPFGQVVEGMENVDKIFSGYGEQPDQGRITAQGKAYLDRNFPKLDKIISASIVPATPAAPKPAAPKSPAAK